MMRVIGSLAILMAFCADADAQQATTVPGSAGNLSSTSSLTDGLLRYLGFTPADRSSVLEKGGVLHSGLIKERQFPEEVAAVGAMLLVGAPNADVVIDAFLDADTFHRVHQVTRHKVLTVDQTRTSAFGDIRFSSSSDIARISGDPLKILNLSRKEAEAFRGSATGAADRVNRAMADVLAARLADFQNKGIAGIVPYDRLKGPAVKPDGELSSALNSMSVLSSQYPGFVQGLRNVNAPKEMVQQYFRLEAPFEGDEVFALSRESRQDYAVSAIGADLHFYASRGYNSMLTIVGVAPHDKRWLVFAINHTFTDQVTGFPSDLKRNVARKQIAERLAKHLETVREGLGNAHSQRSPATPL